MPKKIAVSLPPKEDPAKTALRKAFAERLISPQPLCGERASTHSRQLARQYADMAARFGKARFAAEAETLRRRAQEDEDRRRFWLASERRLALLLR